MMDALLHPMEDPFHQINVENNKDQEDTSDLEDPLESLTKAQYKTSQSLWQTFQQR